MRIPLLMAMTLALVACGGESDPASTAQKELDAALENAAALGASAASGKVSGPSFADWDGRLQELVTLEMAAEAAGLSAADAETKAPPGAPTIIYRWPSERTREVMGRRMPAWDEVLVGYLTTVVTPEAFQARFAPVPEEARRRAVEESDRRAREKGLDEQQRAMARNMVAALSERAPSQPVPGVGDAAVWQQNSPGMLHVLANGTTLQVRVTISDDDATNREASIALARRMLDRL